MRTISAEELRFVSDVSEGLENRITECASKAKSYDELLEMIKTKRYTHARIRRIILSAVLGITRDDVASSPRYIRVLGFNEKGRELIVKMKNEAALPIVTKPKDISLLDEYAAKQFAVECKAADVYGSFGNFSSAEEKGKVVLDS